MICSVLPLEALDAISRCGDNAAALLEAVGGLVSEKPTAAVLQWSGHCSSSSGPQLLLHHTSHRAQLLALQSGAEVAAHSSLSRLALYTAALLQHAALLLLLLVSDSAVLVLPSDQVTPALLQLLHLLNSVYQALLQQHKQQQQQHAAAGSSSAFSQLLSAKQQPVQLHIALQAPAQHALEPEAWPAVAAAAVQQAEHALLKCKAAALSPALLQQRQQQGGPAGRIGASGISSSRRGLLFELAGVHCCCLGSGPNTVPAKRRAVLAAVQQQLLAFDRHKAGPLQSSISTAQQKQKPASTAAAGGAQVAAAGLPGLDQLLQHVVSSTTAAAVAGDESQTAAAGAAHRPPGWLTTEQLQLLWQELLQLLFAADQPSTAAGQAVQPAQDAPNHHQQQQQEEVLTEHTSFLNLALHDLTLTPDDIIQDGDESSMSEDSWDDAEEEGWDEVQQQDEQQQQDSQQQALPGRLLAAAVDPLYFVSAKGCRKAALAAVRAYAEAVPARYTAAVHAAAVQHALQLYAAAATGPAAPELQRQLVSCCQQWWQAGRQQCSQLSSTGRPCLLSLHNTSQEPHSSNTQLRLCTPDGSSVTAVCDWFDLTAANVTPAQQLLQQILTEQQQQQQQQQQEPQQEQQKQGKPQPRHKKQTQQAQQQQQQQVVEEPLGKLLGVQAELRVVQSAQSPSATAGVNSSSSSSSMGLGRHSTGHLPAATAAAAGDIHADGSTPEPSQAEISNMLHSQALNPTGSQGTPQNRESPVRVYLGPWMSLWRFSGVGSAYEPQAGLPGPHWLPGFNKLQQIRVLAPAAEPAAAASKGAVDAADSSAGQQAGGQQRQQQQQQKKQDFASQLKRKGVGDRGGAAAAASSTLEATLGPEDFPTLQQALGGKAGRKQQQQQAPGPGLGLSSTVEPQVAAASADAVAADKASSSGQGQEVGAGGATESTGDQQQQQLLLAAWSQIPSGTATGSAGAAALPASAAAVGGSGAVAAAPAAGSIAAASASEQDRQAGGGRGHRGGRGGGRGGAAAAAGLGGPGGRGRQGGRVAAAQMPTGEPVAAVLTSLWIGLEYESLSGMRVVLQPQQLSAILQQLTPQPQQQQASDTSFASAAAAGVPAAAAAAAAGMSRDTPQDARRRRGGRQQQQQPQPHSRQGAQHSMTQHAVPPAAAGGCGVHGAGVQLLQTDLPLFLHPGQLQLPDTQAGYGGSDRSSGGSAAMPLSMLQLQRIHVRTPAGPFRFASQPRVRLSWQGAEHTRSPRDMLSSTKGASSTCSAATVAGGSSGSANSSSSSGVITECEGQQVLPADSLVVVNLPKVYAAPRDWLHSLGSPAAAASLAATVADEGAVPSQPVGGASVGACGSSSTAQPGAAVACQSEQHSSSKPPAAAVTGGSSDPLAAAATDAVTDSSMARDLVPLLPVLPPRQLRGQGDAETRAEGWSGWLCAGSWLYPVGKS